MVKTKHVLRDNTNKNQGSSSLKANDTLKKIKSNSIFKEKVNRQENSEIKIYKNKLQIVHEEDNECAKQSESIEIKNENIEVKSADCKVFITRLKEEEIKKRIKIEKSKTPKIIILKDCSVALTKLTEYEINKKWTKNKSEPTEKKKKVCNTKELRRSTRQKNSQNKFCIHCDHCKSL